MSLLERTQVLLKKRLQTHSLRMIAEQSNGEVDEWWLTKFAAGKVADPSVNRVQRLHDFLSKRKSSNRAA